MSHPGASVSPGSVSLGSGFGPVYLGIDIGTQSVRVLAVTASGSVAASATHPLASTRDGARHEQEPELWWRAVCACCRSVVAQLGSATPVRGLAVDATSGTILLVDEQLRPLTPGLMYDDGRANEQAAVCNRVGHTLWRALSYRMQPSWALPKLLWLAQNGHLSPRAKSGAKPDAKLAHQNDFINARFAGRLLAADSSNSLKTGFDLLRGQWPGDILEALGLDPAVFPTVVPPGVQIGSVCAAASEQTSLPAGTPIFSGMTDGCAAQISSGATAPGSWNSVVGTTLVLKGVTRDLLHDPLGVVYSHRSADGFWLPGGASGTGAGAISRDFPSADLAALNREALALGPVSLVSYPLLGQGERYPFHAPGAQGFLLGVPSSPAEHFAAVLQGIAFMERLAFAALRQNGAETGSSTGTLTISGGATGSEALNQMRADVLERELSVPSVTEGAFGMAMLAAASESSLAEVTARMVRIERVITPARSFGDYAASYAALLQELASRGWLPEPLARFALEELSA